MQIDTPDELLEAIKLAYRNGGDFALTRIYANSGRLMYYLRFDDTHRPVKTALVRELLKRGAIVKSWGNKLHSVFEVVEQDEEDVYPCSRCKLYEVISHGEHKICSVCEAEIANGSEP